MLCNAMTIGIQTICTAVRCAPIHANHHNVGIQNDLSLKNCQMPDLNI